MGLYTEAAREQEVQLDRQRQVVGEGHPTTLAIALNLSLDLRALGEESGAAVLHARTVEAFRRVLGEDHPATVGATQYVRANCDTDTMQF